MNEFKQILIESAKKSTLLEEYHYIVNSLDELNIYISLNVSNNRKGTLLPILKRMLKEFEYNIDEDISPITFPHNHRSKPRLLDVFIRGKILTEHKDILVQLIPEHRYSSESIIFKFAYFFLIRIGNYAYLKPQDS